MAHHYHILEDITMEEYTCELLCLDSLFVSDNTDCFSLDMEDILFQLSPQIVEAKHNIELQDVSSNKIRTNLNKSNSDWKYKLVEGINLFHYCNMIYVPQTLRKRVLKGYHCYLQHPGGDRLSQTLTTICRCLGIVEQAQKLCITCKEFQRFTNINAKYGLLPTKYAETLTPWNTICVDLIGTYTMIDKDRRPDNKIITKKIRLL